jgi:hypothetical protein
MFRGCSEYVEMDNHLMSHLQRSASHREEACRSHPVIRISIPIKQDVNAMGSVFYDIRSYYHDKMSRMFT